VLDPAGENVQRLSDLVQLPRAHRGLPQPLIGEKILGQG
jgi:hypothetical protein